MNSNLFHKNFVFTKICFRILHKYVNLSKKYAFLNGGKWRLNTKTTANKKLWKSYDGSRRVFIIFLVLAAAAAVLLINRTAPPAYILYDIDTISYEKAVVTSILDEQIHPSDDLPGWNLGSQLLRIRFKNGQMKDQEIELLNYLSTSHNIQVRVGQAVIVKSDRPEGAEPYYTLYSYDRAGGLASVGLLFTALIFAVGGVKGLRSILGMAFSVFLVVFFLLPSIYRGWPPVPTAILTAAFIAVFSILALNGCSKKSFTALLSVVAGTLISALFYAAISGILSITGYHVPEAEELILVSRETGLKVRDVLFAGVLISSIGAVIDTAVSVAASVFEVREQQPRIRSKELFLSGMVVGRDVIGATTMTLIMAFVGGSLPVLLTLTAYGARIDQILSSDYVAIEVARGITGTMAIAAVTPVTAAFASYYASRQSVQTKK